MRENREVWRRGIENKQKQSRRHCRQPCFFRIAFCRKQLVSNLDRDLLYGYNHRIWWYRDSSSLERAF